MSQVNYMQPLQNIINEYRSKSPTELESLIGKDNHFEFSENDKNYQIEVNLLWDDQAKKLYVWTFLQITLRSGSGAISVIDQFIVC